MAFSDGEPLRATENTADSTYETVELMEYSNVRDEGSYFWVMNEAAANF